jgi:V/A-type H+-transporting ATPase subunit E
MSNSIRELTEKIYNEGVLKAVREAELIRAEAKKEAENIIHSANQEKTMIIDQATREAEELKKKAGSEISLAAKKMISNLKQKINSSLISVQTESITRQTYNDETFVKEMLLAVVQSWTARNTDESELSILVPQNEEKKIAAWFKDKLTWQLNQGIEIKVDPTIKNGFKIGPKDGNYIISFTDQDFENYFKIYLKEKTWKLIFGSEQEVITV